MTAANSFFCSKIVFKTPNKGVEKKLANSSLWPLLSFSASKIAAIFCRNLSRTNRSQNVADVGSTFTLNLQFFCDSVAMHLTFESFLRKKIS